MLKGLGVGDVCRRVGSDFGCSARTVGRDLDRMEEWVPSLFYGGDSWMEAYRLLHIDLCSLDSLLRSIKYESENDYVKLSALNVISRNLWRRIKLLEDFGVFEEYRRHLEYLE